MKRLRVLAALAFLLAGASTVSAVPLVCDISVGAPGTGECQITGPHSLTGPLEVDRTLHILGFGRIDASGGGITLNICVAPAPAAATCDLIMDTPLVAGGGQIEASDTGAAGNSGSPIVINVSRDVIMKANSAILSNNTNDGGGGGNITIAAGRDMTMCAAAGAQPDCGGASPGPGAQISAQKLAGGTANGGNITITVGDKSKATGAFYMEGGVNVYGAETGAKIDTTSTTAHGGNITINAGASYFTEPGSVVQSGGHDLTATPNGGKIFIVSGCHLTTEGRITSKGPDSGADLVHLEGCEIVVRGLVESTGKGHNAEAKNSCDNVDDGLVGEVFRLGKPANATGCIEVWGDVITIDAGSGWAGELNADIGNGGPAGMGWIDIFARSSLVIIDGTGNDRISNNLGHAYFSTYAVHANAIDGSDNTPGIVTALVKNGPLTASGFAFEASSTMTAATGHDDGNINDQFVGNGSTGGTIDIEASGTVTVTGAFLNASGDFGGGPPCPSGAGACGSGGHLIVKAWGLASNIEWQPGDGNVQPNTSGGTTIGGDIVLNACGAINIATTNFHGESPVLSNICDATKPDLPVYNSKADGTGTPVVIFDTATWALCTEILPEPAAIGDFVWLDKNANGQQDALEPGIPNVTVTLRDCANNPVMDINGNAVLPQLTDANGNYLFTNLVPGCYKVLFTTPAGYTPSPANVGADATDSDPVGGTTGNYTLVSGETNLTVDAGFYQPASLGDFVWNDTNANGQQNGGEPGIPNVTVTLRTCANNPVTDINGNPVAAQLTNGSGNYLFTNLVPGCYKVLFTTPAGFTASPANVGADATDSDPVGGTTQNYTLVSGETNLTVDAGFYEPPGSIAIVKTPDGSTFGVGDQVNFTIVVSSKGPGVAKNVMVSDPLPIPGNLTSWIMTTNPGGACSITGTTPPTLNCSFGDLANGQTRTIVIATNTAGGANQTACTANNGRVNNTATVTSTGLTNKTDTGFWTCDRTLVRGDTATIGFWHNKNGQALIKAVNGGATAKNLATWLATNFPYLYGANSTTNVTGKTNNDVAALFLTFFGKSGMKTDAQIMGAAIAVYVTSSTLAGGNYAAGYGFNVTPGGIGSKTYNVGSLGTAIGLSNNTFYTILQLLQQANLRKQQGLFDANAFNVIFSAINESGDII